MHKTARGQINSQLSVTVHTGTVYWTLTGAHHVGGPCDGASSTGVVFSACALGAAALVEQMLAKFQNLCQSFWTWKRQTSARNWRALGGNGILLHSPDQAGPLARTNGELAEGPARAELKLFLAEQTSKRENRETKWRLTH